MGRINMALWPKFAKAINGDLKILPPPQCRTAAEPFSAPRGPVLDLGRRKKSG